MENSITLNEGLDVQIDLFQRTQGASGWFIDCAKSSGHGDAPDEKSITLSLLRSKPASARARC